MIQPKTTVHFTSLVREMLESRRGERSTSKLLADIVRRYVALVGSADPDHADSQSILQELEPVLEQWEPDLSVLVESFRARLQKHKLSADSEELCLLLDARQILILLDCYERYKTKKETRNE